MNARALVGRCDILWLVLDTLRHDVAVEELEAGRTPVLRAMLPGGWERRHTPASFTYPAHQAFFAGFLPTPADPGRHPRLFATRFPGSETTSDQTYVFDAPDIIHGLAAVGYHTVCIGGVGFFNPAHPLGQVLPGYFAEAHYSEAMGVTGTSSERAQVALALEVLRRAAGRRLLLFMNISALHQPNRHYLPGASVDSRASHAAALRAVDAALEPLFAALPRPTLCLLMSDHGTAYGEDGYHGHRLAHPVVWDVPYAEVVVGSVPW